MTEMEFIGKQFSEIPELIRLQLMKKLQEQYGRTPNVEKIVEAYKLKPKGGDNNDF